MFYVVNEFGDRLARASTEGRAVALLDALIAGDPRAANKHAVVQIDGDGHRIGDPITRERRRPAIHISIGHSGEIGVHWEDAALVGDGLAVAAL
jgi:hypothetical protein